MAIFHWFSSFRDIAILWWHWYILIYPFIIVRNIKFSIVRCGCVREVTKSRKETLPFISQCQLYRPKLDWSTEFEIWNIACLHHCWYCLPGSPALFPRLQSILHYSTFFTSMYMILPCAVHFSSLLEQYFLLSSRGSLHFSCQQFSCESSEWTFFWQR